MSKNTKNESLRRRRRSDNNDNPAPQCGTLTPQTPIPVPSSSTTATTATPTTSIHNNDNVWPIVKSHLLTHLILWIGIPYVSWVGYRWIRLQHPPISTWRPAVHVHDVRQLLILGTMSSGTSSIAHYLSPYLEIGHEDSDTSWKFVRDGTVSWFHGIRYWPVTATTTTTTTTTTITTAAGAGDGDTTTTIRDYRIAQLCKVQWMFYTSNSLSDNYGFGPTLFGTPEYNCSWWQQSPSIPMSCYRHACETALQREYACATAVVINTTITTIDNSTSSSNRSRNSTSKSKSSPTDHPGCVTPYQTTLVQTREPWKIVSSLVAKYCHDEKQHPSTTTTATTTTKEGQQQQQHQQQQIRDHLPPTLQWLLLALQIPPSNHCVVQCIEYVVQYYETMMSHGLRRYKVEDLPTDPKDAACEVMRMAGLDQWETTVYKPNHEMYQRNCLHRKQLPPLSKKSILSPMKINAINKGRVHWEDLLPFVPDESIVKMKRLYKLLDYDYPTSNRQ